MVNDRTTQLKKLSLKLTKASNPETVVQEVQSLKLADARTVMNELRKKRKKREVVADALISYYCMVESSHITTNVIQAICHHGNHRHLSFMLQVIRNFVREPRTRNQSYAIQSAIRGAGYLGRPEDAQRLFLAGIPWKPRPNISERELDHEFARSVTLMLVKRDGHGTRDLGSDYFYRVRDYSGPCGVGLVGLTMEVQQILNDVIGAKCEQCELIMKELDERFRMAKEANSLIAMSYRPGYSDPSQSKLDMEFEKRLKREPSIQFCEKCGVRMTYTTACVYSDLGRCPRCLFLGLRTWLVDVKGLSPNLWEHPPKNSPVSCTKSVIGASFCRGRKWSKSTIRSYDLALQRLRDFGPSKVFWHNLMLNFASDDSTCSIKIQGKYRHVTISLTDHPSNPGGLLPRALFCLWKGEIALANDHGELWRNEEASVRIVSDLLGERGLRQWTADWLVNDETGANMFVDGYFPENSIAVEHQGIQHFEPVDFFGGEQRFLELTRRDSLKRRLLEQHDVSVLYIRYDEVDRKTIALKLARVRESRSPPQDTET
jgi:hypothetical protein